MPLLDCGHEGNHISGFPGNTKCWDCHLDHLRANGQSERAERLIVLKRQQDEGRLNIEQHRLHFINSLTNAYKKGN